MKDLIKHNIFVRLCAFSVGAVFVGIISGFVLGLLISLLGYLAAYLECLFKSSECYSYSTFPLAGTTGLGMCVGGFFGALFGALAAFKKE